MDQPTIEESIKKYLNNQYAPQQNINQMHDLEMRYGKRAKRVIDKQKTSQNYHKTKIIQTPLLNHYENVDWYERDSTYDF